MFTFWELIEEQFKNLGFVFFNIHGLTFIVFSKENYKIEDILNTLVLCWVSHFGAVSQKHKSCPHEFYWERKLRYQSSHRDPL